MKRSLAVVSVALALGATACGAGSRAAPQPGSAVRGAASLRCPPRAPQLRVAGKLRSGTRFAQVGASVLVLCRYRGLNATPPRRLARARRIASVARITELTRILDSLPARGRRMYACPMDDGSEIVLLFGYRSRRPERVVVGLRGCMIITNGRVGTLALLSRKGSHFVRRLKALTDP
jgi:hypothetical protein